VEGEAGLVARAVRNAELNGITNTRFLTADLMQPGWSFFREPRDVVVLDPPRTGAEAAVAEMDRIAPRCIVYVSCHPATLARDAQVLVERHGYRLRTSGCSTCSHHHVEALACSTRLIGRAGRGSSRRRIPRLRFRKYYSAGEDRHEAHRHSGARGSVALSASGQETQRQVLGTSVVPTRYQLT
jgi:hypothetical protein